MNYTPQEVRLDQLLLDPNNYRYYDMEEYTTVQPNRVHEPNVQQRAEDLIKLDGKEELRALKESIEANGYIPVEIMVVKPYEFKEGLFLVIEGNRRTTAMRWLKQDFDGGSSIPQELIDNLEKIPAIILTGNEDAKLVRHVLMGLRHVSGIKQWGGYQRAKLVAELVDEFDSTLTEAAKRIGMSAHEASRRYRALKALQQMQDDEEFGPSADPNMYRLFHEAVSVVKIKEWLDWNDEEYRFTNEKNKERFYNLLLPSMPEDEEEAGRTREPKVKTYSDVRDLRDILGNVEAEDALFDPDVSFNEALATAKASAAQNWIPRIKAAYQTLEKMPTTTLKSLAESEVSQLKRLYGILKGTLTDWAKLTEHDIEL